MRHEKIIKRADGTQYQICINVHLDSIYDRANYRVDLYYRLKGKRKWLHVAYGSDDFKYRALSMKDREIHRNKNMLLFVTKKEIYNAKLELWNLLKPPIYET